MSEKISLILGGDVMLGRLVNDAIRQFGYEYPLGKIAHLMRRGDITLVNLECAITASEKLWPGAPKYFYFCAPLLAGESLAHAGVKLVSLANNHALDCDYQGLYDTFEQLKKHGIVYAGAGHNLEEAVRPAILNCKNKKFGMVSYCNHQMDFAATPTQAGIAYIDLSEEKTTIIQFNEGIAYLKKLDVDWPILSLHWGPNQVERPSRYFQHLAHQAVELGFKIIFGHSAHVFHGIEIYKDSLIFYAAGDLVDDYYVDPYFRNDHQLLFEVEIDDNHFSRIFLYPIFISYCHTAPARAEQFDFIFRRLQRLCHEMGTEVIPYDEQRLEIKKI